MNRAERRRLEKERRKNKVSQPISFEDQLEQAMRKLQGGQFKQADKIFNNLVKSYPDEPTSLHFAGITKYQLGLYSEALTLLSNVVRVAPQYAEAHNSLGIVYLEQHDYKNAKQCFEKAITLKSDYANAYTNLGNALKELKEMSDAVSAFEDALRYHPQSSEAAYGLASTLLALDKPDSALNAANKCIEFDPYCQNANAYKAMALLQIGRKDEWQELYNYNEFIGQLNLEVPNKFNSLQEFNHRLEQDIRNHSTLTWEPLERVTHGGAVTKDMMINPSKTILAFEKSLRKAIDQYIKTIQKDSNHPFLKRAPSRYRITLIASILQAKGWHPPHIHESSWLSGCYYVRVPPVVGNSNSDHSGWIQFGVPDYALPKDCVLEITAKQPKEGIAVSFPSYFFHGTIPYEKDSERIGIAFDVYPSN